MAKVQTQPQPPVYKKKQQDRTMKRIKKQQAQMPNVAGLKLSDNDAYEEEKQRYLLHLEHSSAQGRHGVQEEWRTTPLLSLAAKHAIENDFSSCGASTFPRSGLLGFHVGDDDKIGYREPVLFNTNAPNSMFICGQQGMIKCSIPSLEIIADDPLIRVG